MGEVTVTIVGSVVAQPRTAVMADGTTRATFRVACTERRFDPGLRAFIDGEVTYFTVIAWDRLAQHCATSLSLGDPVIVTGRLRVRHWQHEGRLGATVEVRATAVGHDLARGTTAFTRARRGPSFAQALAEPHGDRGVGAEPPAALPRLT
jgi:single-strand DNA-binding protein